MVQEQVKKDTSLFRLDSFLGGKGGSLGTTVDEIVQLCKNMSIADAVHDNKIADNVQNLQSRCLDLVQAISKKMEGPDPLSPYSVDSSLSICAELLAEVQGDVLQVPTETCSKSTEFTTKSTVQSVFRILTST